MKIYVKKVADVSLPQQSHNGDAGYDIIATSGAKIVGTKYTTEGGAEYWESIDYIEFETNLYIAPSVLTAHTLIFPRSSISKYNLSLANSIGLVDNSYRGQVLCRFNYLWQPSDFVIIEKLGHSVIVGNPNSHKIYKKDDKIAQLVFNPTVQAEFEFIDELPSTERGTGGFGSTGISTTPQIAKTPKDYTKTIIEKYTELGGIPTQTPYSEQIKKREQT